MKRFIMCTIACLLVFSGCRRCAKKVQQTFKQAEKCKQCCVNDAREQLRSEAVRNGLATVDHIYVLPLLPEVCEVHDCLLNCCSTESEKNKKPEKMTFVVLMDRTRDDWNMLLSVEGKVYNAEKIKNSDVDRAYKKIFGDWVVAVKQNAYEVTFDRAPLGDESSFSLQLCDGTYVVNFCWGICEEKRSCWDHGCKDCK